jgi:hypothetical protein
MTVSIFQCTTLNKALTCYGTDLKKPQSVELSTLNKAYHTKCQN